MAMPPVRPPKIRGTQKGLKEPAQVDTIKADMLADRFDYVATRAVISGIRDRRGVIHIMEGHHRVVAALEIYWETGNSAPLFQLLSCGKIDGQSQGPWGSRPMPLRSLWGKFRNWIGY